MASEKRKIWDIEVPLMGQNLTALAVNPDTLEGKFIKFDLTRVLKGRNLEANLLITKKDGKLTADFVSLNLLMSYSRRMMRKNISWIEDSFSCKTKDAKVRVKPFMITKKRVHRSVRASLRNTAKEFVTKFAAEKSAENVFDAVISGSLQKELSNRLKTVYPLAFCEIRVLKLEK